MIYEFEVLADIISPKTNKVVKKDIIYKRTFDTDTIGIEEFLDEKGKKIAKYCMINDKEKIYKVNHPYSTIIELLKPVKVIGLIGKTKSYKKRKYV